MILHTDRLVIRPVRESDWQRLGEIWADFSQSPYAQYDKPSDTDEQAIRARVARWAQANSGREHMFFAVCLQDTLIGYIACNIRERGYEIGYCFHSGYHGKGYAKESHLALFAYLRGLGVTRFSAGTALRNLPSVGLLKALGFKQTGTEQVSFYRDEAGSPIYFEGGIFELSTADGQT